MTGSGEWILLVMLLHLCCSSRGLVSDGGILLEFKSSVYDRLNSLGTWGRPGEDPCNGKEDPGSGWAGVSCNNMSGSGLQVSALELRSLSLVSDDVSVLANLTNLYKLDLRDNSFAGEPPDLSKLQTLVFLYLGDNRFKGRLADRFPLGLSELEVQNNLFTGEIGTTNLFNLTLQRLDLHGNNFSGELPDMSYSGLEALTYFDVSGNQFQGPLPSKLTGLDVRYCNMSGNSFTGKIEVDQTRGWFPTGVLDLSKNRLDGDIPAKLFNSSFGMTYLDLSDNDLEGPIPSEFSEQLRTELQFMYLEKNRLTGDFYQLLRSNLSSLVELRLQGNARTVGGEFNESGANDCKGHIPWGGNTMLLSGSCCVQYEYSDFINYTETVPPSGVSRTVKLPDLRVLDLSGCGLEGNIPSDIFNPQALPALRRLDLSRNSLNGTIPVGLMQMPRLLELRLGRNSLIGIMDNLVDRNWSNLQVLDIHVNCLWVTSGTVENVLKFPRLKELWLGSNPVSKGIHLPTLLGLNRPLETLEVLDLRDLYMDGNISDSYSSPELFPSLRYLDLSENLISGPVPAGLRNMPRLTYLNLSHNSLSGAIPLLPSVLFNSEYFMGNDRLCGPPLEYCSVPTKSLALWKILLVVAVSVLLSSGSCLFLGWIWRRRTDAKKHKQDAELIAALLDRDTTTLMPLRELRKATDDFSNQNQVGEGAFGTVYRGVLEDGTVVAIKRSKRDGSTSEDKCQFLNEVKILSQVHHRNLVRLLGCCLANKNALLVFEFVPNGTLQEHLHAEHGYTPLSWNQRLVIAIQTANALDYLHSSANPPIYHLDVKSANILLDSNLNAKVADFGISRLAPGLDATHITTLHGFQGTFGYMDPEMVVQSVLTGKSDVYAFGVVLLELITAKAVVDRSRGEDVSLSKWARRMIQTGSLEEVIDPVILDTYRTLDGKESIDAVARLAMECLLFRSEDRPTMKDASTYLLSIQQRNGPPSSTWTATTRNEEILIELSSSIKGFTIESNS